MCAIFRQYGYKTKLYNDVMCAIFRQYGYKTGIVQRPELEPRVSYIVLAVSGFIVSPSLSSFSFSVKGRMLPTKVCPQCCAVVNLRKSVCECGHYFVLKKKTSVNSKSLRKSKRIAMQTKRALESTFQTTLRQNNDSERKAKKKEL